MEINDIRNIKIEDFNYPLPDERIAKHPLAQRDACKLLLYKEGNITDHIFSEIPSLLPERATLIYNNTRVINARLRFRKPNGGALIEIFCLEPFAPRDYAQVFQTTDRCAWLCFVGNSKRWKDAALEMEVPVNGTTVILSATRLEKRGNASVVEFSWNAEGITFASLLDAIGEIPIPPYLNRNTEASDLSDYQTVYSHIAGSVAAPTAGLHFTDEVLEEVDKRGILRRELTLHVGAGTFQPVKSETIGDHAMHTEFISVQRSLIEDIINAPGKIVAVGTTSVRTLESLYYIGVILHNNPDATTEQLNVPQWMPYSAENNVLTTEEAMREILAYLDRNNTDTYLGSTAIMIAPSYQFHVIDGIITNFHQPQSTLLLLVSALVKGDWQSMYSHALEGGYRFLSYGDANLIWRK